MALARRTAVELNVTGEACVLALLRAGFQLKHRGNGLALLKKDGRIVMVPDVELLEPDMLRAILRSANLDPQELAHHLRHSPTRSGFFAKSGAPKSNGHNE